MNNPFYSSIGRYYDYIFPYNPAKKAFTESFLNQSSDNLLLDIGCGTGDLALDLAGDENAVYAIDNDQEMIKQAIRKKMPMHLDEYPVFRDFDMKRISKFFDQAKFDGITCYGNTLVHLEDKQQISDFIQSCHSTLKKDGHLMLQLLNYDYILNHNIKELPLIDNEMVKFERFYESSGSDHLDFVTRLTIKQDQSVLTNRIQLYPIVQNEIEEILTDAGFKNIRFYGDFNKSPFKQDGIPLLVDVKKS